jgi:beta-lactamase superfamily II metal-dependent hydrolase
MAKQQTKKGTRKRKGPENVSVTMYDVGFGDCFLLTFDYGNDGKRHILIDCGSTSVRKAHMSKVVDQLVKDCQGHVDAVVATHRHADHISAFGLQGLDAKLEALNPEVVIQPWTEHPKAKDAALEAPSVFGNVAAAHMLSLDTAQQFAQHLVDNPLRILAAAGPNTRKQLARIAALSIPNKKAIMCLTRMGRRHAYVYAGADCGLKSLLPGVRVSVLGPPTLKQSEGIRTQKRWDENEFWKLYAGVAQASGANPTSARGHSMLFPQTQTDSIAAAPSYIKWVIHQVDNAQLHNVKRIVRTLDDALNNTSVVLLFEIGDKALLFPGDAQLENWQYALEDADLKKRLKKTTLYKVGHHGSTNATPQSLWALFKYQRARRNRLASLLSTHKGHHSQVPRESLVEALRNETAFHTTEDYHNKLREVYVV